MEPLSKASLPAGGWGCGLHTPWLSPHGPAWSAARVRPWPPPGASRCWCGRDSERCACSPPSAALGLGLGLATCLQGERCVVRALWGVGAEGGVSALCLWGSLGSPHCRLQTPQPPHPRAQTC